MSDEDEVEAPVLSTIADMTAASLENSSLEDRDLMIARIAALAAVGAPPASYLLNAGAAMDAGVTLEDVQGVLVAVAPIIGTPRVVIAAAGITTALGFAIELGDVVAGGGFPIEVATGGDVSDDDD
jgi:alkylhydroperoxidase/carboxymuconolactone decarboxylase family protein YurZ